MSPLIGMEDLTGIRRTVLRCSLRSFDMSIAVGLLDSYRDL